MNPESKKIAILALTPGGFSLAEGLADEIPGAFPAGKGDRVSRTLASLWGEVDGFVCIMAAGIVVRAVSSLLRDKKSDPCIVVLDEKGRYAVSLLSGHLGGGNELAARIAGLTGGQAVITTASDTLGLPALDLWIREQDLVPEDSKDLTGISARLVESGGLTVYSEIPVDSLPEGLSELSDIHRADIVVSNRIDLPDRPGILRPRNLVVGVGCNRGTPVQEFEEALTELFAEAGMSFLSVRNLASMDLKSDESGLLDFAGLHNWRIDFYSRDELSAVKNLTVSPAVLKAVGATGVAEPASLLSVQDHNYTEEVLFKKLIIRKRKWRNVTMAVAEAGFTLSAQARVRQST
ncbi:MAG: cobalt-precorrin 5A hydrolase [Desulfurivibrionaceae bacterium]